MIKRKPTRIKRKIGKRATKGKKSPSISKLIKVADALLSAKVRQKSANPDVLVACYTCKMLFPPKKLHCGHFLSRYYKAARWHEDNVRPQCFMCNLWKRGDSIRFRQNLIKEIGVERVEAIEAMRDQSIKLTREFLEQKIKEFMV